MSRRHRILAWVKTDAQRMKDEAQRMKDEAVLAKVTARVTKGLHPQTLLSDMLWSEVDRAVLAARKQAPLVFNQIGPA